MNKIRKVSKPSMLWYVAMILPKTDNKITSYIESDELLAETGIKTWYPKRRRYIFKKGKKTEVEEAIYPNYMLFLLPRNDTYIHKLLLEKNTSILSFLTKTEKGIEMLSPLSEQEIEWTQTLCNDVIDIDIRQVIGKKVYVIKGPFKNMVGIVKSLIKNTATMLVRVEIDLYGSILKPEINFDYLEVME